MQIETEAHRTRSLYGAAFLLAVGFDLVDTLRDPLGRVEFILGGDPFRLQAELHKWRLGTATVNAVRFADALRRLKGLVHERD